MFATWSGYICRWRHIVRIRVLWKQRNPLTVKVFDKEGDKAVHKQVHKTNAAVPKGGQKGV